MVLALTGSPPNTAAMVNSAVNTELATFWTPLAGLADVGRNKLHNPLFNINQRAGGAVTTAAYGMDRWLTGVSLDTISMTQATLADSDRTAIGDEEAQYALQNVFTGNAGAGAFNLVMQRIENVRRLSGKTITVSFWGKASAALQVGLGVGQVFGTGGSPSAAVNVTTTGSVVTLSTTWTRYAMTIAVPSASSKTFGTTANTDYTRIALAFSCGTTNAAFYGGIGVQSGTVTLWGVQVETGSAMTALEKPDPRHDLANCQRFYQSGLVQWIGYVTNTYSYTAYSPFPVTMRAAPAATVLANNNLNLGTPTLTATNGGVTASATASSTAQGTLNVSYTVSADL